MYRQINVDGQVSTEIIQRIADTAFIPCVAGNADYDQYLEWAKTHTINPPLESE